MTVLTSAKAPGVGGSFVTPGGTFESFETSDPATLGTVVTVLGSTQGPAVGINAADTPLGTGIGHTFKGTETVELSAVAIFANISEGGAQPSDLTFGVLFDGGALETRSIESYAAGEVGATLALQAGPFTPSAGPHAIIMVATASAGAGNCQVPAGGANLIVRIYG